jgi:hypothetical protein
MDEVRWGCVGDGVVRFDDGPDFMEGSTGQEDRRGWVIGSSGVRGAAACGDGC